VVVDEGAQDQPQNCNHQPNPTKPMASNRQVLPAQRRAWDRPSRLSRFHPSNKLQPIAANTSLGTVVDTLNANVERLNSLLFTWLDYAAIGRRP